MRFKKTIKNLLKKIDDLNTKLIIKRKKYYVKFYGRYYKKISKTANIITDGKVKFNNSIYSKNQNYEKGIFVVQDDAKVIMESGSEFRSGCKFFVFKGASFSIGRNSFININSFVECRENISIGRDTLISRNVTIIDGDTHLINGKKSQKPICIGNNVLIGTNSIILKGVTIGNGSIIGAGSVVTHDIPSGCMAAGNPAIVIKEGVLWKR